MTEFVITTDRQGVRDLREMRRQLRNGGEVVAGKPPVEGGDKVVEIISNIAANDFKQHEAWLVALIDGEWTRQTKVNVRKIGTGSINASSAAPVRTIATRIGKNGYCVTSEGT